MNGTTAWAAGIPVNVTAPATTSAAPSRAARLNDIIYSLTRRTKGRVCPARGVRLFPGRITVNGADETYTP
ncbi:hypothetical protein GCM10009555_000730 [Acrocarpospora macrocephala]